MGKTCGTHYGKKTCAIFRRTSSCSATYGKEGVVNVNSLDRSTVNIIFISKIFASKLEGLIVNLWDPTQCKTYDECRHRHCILPYFKILY